MNLMLRQTGALAWRSVVTTIRIPQAWFPSLFFPLALLAIFTASFSNAPGHVPGFPPVRGFLDFAVAHGLGFRVRHEVGEHQHQQMRRRRGRFSGNNWQRSDPMSIAALRLERGLSDDLLQVAPFRRFVHVGNSRWQQAPANPSAYL